MAEYEGREWVDFHDCEVRDDTHESWTEEGRRLHAVAAEFYERFNVLLLADFEGSDGEQGTRRSSWRRRWPE